MAVVIIEKRAHFEDINGQEVELSRTVETRGIRIRHVVGIECFNDVVIDMRDIDNLIQALEAMK